MLAASFVSIPTRWHGVTAPAGVDGLCPPGVSGQYARNKDVSMGCPLDAVPAPGGAGGLPATPDVVPVLTGTGGGVGNGNGGTAAADAGATIPVPIGVPPMVPPGLPDCDSSNVTILSLTLIRSLSNFPVKLQIHGPMVGLHLGVEGCYLHLYNHGCLLPEVASLS